MACLHKNVSRQRNRRRRRLSAVRFTKVNTKIETPAHHPLPHAPLVHTLFLRVPKRFAPFEVMRFLFKSQGAFKLLVP